MWKQRSENVMYDEKNQPPVQWFMPVSELNSDDSKKYIDPEARMKLMRKSLEIMIKEKTNERKKK